MDGVFNIQETPMSKSSKEVSYQEETYDESINDIKKIIDDHYEEIALYKDKIKLNPNFDFYEQADKNDTIRFYTARVEDNLVGYMVTFVAKHPHYDDHIFANNDIIFLDKEYRNLSAGRGLISFAENKLKEEGVSVFNINTKVHQPFDNLMLSLGYDCVDRIYGKYIGE